MSEKIGQSWLDKLDELLKENNKLTLFLLLQTVIVGLFVIGYIKLSNKLEVNVELPKIIKEDGLIVVGKDYANGRFFTMWAREDVENISTFNHKSIKDKMQYLRDRMYPPSYYKYETLIKEYEKQASINLISQHFTFAKENIKIKIKEETNSVAVVEIKGFYSKAIDGEEVVKSVECGYELGYKIEGGHIYVESFKTNCK